MHIWIFGLFLLKILILYDFDDFVRHSSEIELLWYHLLGKYFAYKDSYNLGQYQSELFFYKKATIFRNYFLFCFKIHIRPNFHYFSLHIC